MSEPVDFMVTMARMLELRRVLVLLVGAMVGAAKEGPRRGILGLGWGRRRDDSINILATNQSLLAPLSQIPLKSQRTHIYPKHENLDENKSVTQTLFKCVLTRHP